MAPWVEVFKSDQVPQGQAKVAIVAGKRLALARTRGRLYALEDVCTHDGGPLGEGQLADNLIECPRHGARFDLETGRPVCLPAVLPVETFPVKEEGGKIYVELKEEEKSAR